MIIALFCAAAVYLYLRGRKQRELGKDNGGTMLAFYILAMALTVFNPLIANFALEKVHALQDPYYRYFWALPIAAVIAYACADIVTKQEKKHHAVILGLVLVYIIAFCGTPFFTSGRFHRPENIYNVQDNMIEIVEYIHEDDAGGQPVAVFPEEYAVTVRQYDAGIQLAYGREMFLGWKTTSDKRINKQLRYIYQALYTDELETVDKGELQKYLAEAGVEYIVLPPESAKGTYIDQNGYELADDIGGYDVFRKVSP